MSEYSEVLLSKGEIALGKILPFAIRFCAFGSIVIQNETLFSQEKKSLFLDLIKAKIIDRSFVSAWPGTTLVVDKVELIRFEFDAECVQLLMSVASSLSEFLSPELPEDLCLYRRDGSVFLTSIAHEGDFFLTLLESEIEAWEVKSE